MRRRGRRSPPRWAAGAAALAAALAAAYFAGRSSGPPGGSPAERSAPPPLPPPAASLEESRDRAVRWLLRVQKVDGAFVIKGNREVAVWETLLALQALAPVPDVGDRLSAGWGYLRLAVRNDGLAFWGANQGVDFWDSEATGLLLSLEAGRSLWPTGAACRGIDERTTDDGSVAEGGDLEFVPESLQSYPSVTGYALRYARACPAFWRRRGRALVARAKEVLARPQSIRPVWQVYGTEFYVLHSLAAGLAAVGHLSPAESKSILDYAASRQSPDGGFGPVRDEAVLTSRPLATAWALEALVYARPKPDDPVLRRSLAFMAASQRLDGSIPGGTYRTISADVVSTALWVDILNRFLRQPPRSPRARPASGS